MRLLLSVLARNCYLKKTFALSSNAFESTCYNTLNVNFGNIKPCNVLLLPSEDVSDDIHFNVLVLSFKNENSFLIELDYFTVN